jgi:predicted O-methyltransferase YrrM
LSPLRPRIAPDSGLAGVGHRLRMASAARGLRGEADRVPRAVAIALRDTALGRAPADEREWTDRVERNAREIAAPLDIPEAVRWMSLPPVWGRFLTRLVRQLAPECAVELGTGFGVSTAYQAAALELNGRGEITSFDVEKMLALAGPGLDAVGLRQRVEIVEGDISATLPPRLAEIGTVDYALIDHDHTAAGTLEAFDALLPHLAPGAAVVFDDIEWTEDMRSAWAAVGGRERVATTIGLRRVGVAAIEDEAAA